MGVAIRMATLMMLHREETYQLQHKTPETIMAAESARRTIWMLHSQDNLHSGPSSPVSLSAADITTLLPCDEEDFARGTEPASRAALDGTQPAKDNPALLSDKNRSLFATLMQIHHLWGTVGRRTVYYSRSPKPWDSNSQFSQMVTTLREWEAALPPSHLFSKQLLRRYKDVGEDLAYLCVTMMTRLCNIVLRRPYLADVIRRNVKERRQQEFFSAMALDLFQNVRGLYEQIDAQFTDRTPDESVGAQIASFCVYSCGLFSTYLCKFPAICPDQSIAAAGPMMLERTIGILNESKEVWPLAARWADALEKFSRDPKSMPLTTEGSMDDGKDPIPRAIRALPPISKSAASAAAAAAMPDRALPLPGTQPASATSTAMSSPRNGHVTHPMAPSSHGVPPPNQNYGHHMNQPHSPHASQHHSHLNQYQTNQPPPPPQQYMQPPQQPHFRNQPPHPLHSPTQHQQGTLQHLPSDPSSYHQNLPNVPMGASDHHPRAVFWTPNGPVPPQVNLGRQHPGPLPPDAGPMLIDVFDPSVQGYMHNAMLSPDEIVAQNLRDGFEGELVMHLGDNGVPLLSLDQWIGQSMFTAT